MSDLKDYRKEYLSTVLNWVINAGQSFSVQNLFYSLTRLNSLCKVVASETKLYALLYPDVYNTQYPKVVQIHSVLSPEGRKRVKDHLTMLKRYMNFLKNLGFEEAVIECEPTNRLIKYIAIKCGFILEDENTKLRLKTCL